MSDAPPPTKRSLDRHLWFMLALAAVVLLPRAAMIARAHSDYADDQYHFVRGQRFLAGMLATRPLALNDPPLGEAITALPLWWSGARAYAGNVIYEQRAATPEALLLRVAIWKAFLFIPMIGVAFVWARQLYGARAGWFAGLLLVFEPTFAAHISTGALDVLGAEAIFIACYLAWRFAAGPTIIGAIALAALVALAMLIKHTAIILPVVVATMLIVWRVKSWKQIALATLLAALFAWALLGFDISKPTLPKDWSDNPAHARLASLLDRRLPGGMYAGAIVGAMHHRDRGHSAYLFGEIRTHGWWYYFPVVTTYKVPIGYALLGALAIASCMFIRPKFDELSLAIPAAAWTIFLIASGVNIGWRHFLPAYAFMLILASRAATIDRRAFSIGAFVCFAIGAVHTLMWHPNYLSYLNAPRDKPYLAVSDCNLDWGQSIKQTRDWIKSHPELSSGRNHVFVRTFARDESPALDLYLGKLRNVHVLRMKDPPPRSGTLIVSSVWLSGLYNEGDYLPLQREQPIDTIGGGAMLVFDLGRIKGWKNRQSNAP